MEGTNYSAETTVEGGFSDVMLVPSPTTPGKMTFAWGPDGDLLFDNTCSYAVLMLVVTPKGTYRPDRQQGTRVRTVVQDTSTTGSLLSSYAREAGPQLDELVKNMTARSERIAQGRWRLNLRWNAAGDQVEKRLEVSR